MRICVLMSVESKIRLPFMKMHGLGNDFVVVDGRDSRIELTDSLISAVADRHRGVGFDQLAVILPSDVDAHQRRWVKSQQADRTQHHDVDPQQPR